VDTRPWLKVSPGSRATIRGLAEEGSPDSDLSAAEIVEAGSNPGVVVSAEALSKEFLADRKRTKAKYDEKYAYLDGEVVERTDKDGAITLTLKGDRDVVVWCAFGSGAKELAAARPGQKAKLFGRLSLFAGEKDNILHVRSCALTELK
jgi:hypothetical protein